MNKVGGISLGTLLLVLFIALKLTGHITWSWLWVLSPFWIPAALGMTVLFAFLVVSIIAAALSGR